MFFVYLQRSFFLQFFCLQQFPFCLQRLLFICSGSRFFCSASVFFVCSASFLFAAFVFCLQRIFFVCSVRFLFAAHLFCLQRFSLFAAFPLWAIVHIFIYPHILECIDVVSDSKHLPSKPYVNEGIRSLMQTRDHWQKLARKTNDALVWSGYKFFKREVKRELRIAEHIGKQSKLSKLEKKF